VKFLLDQNQSPLLVGALVEFGHEAVHVRDLGMSRASDTEILAFAHREGLVILSSDTDFGELLARSNAALPSVVLFRRQGERRAAQIAALLAANLDSVAEDLDAGAIVVLEADRVRIRRLPMRRETS
jgi:predicted nuclease of predicted toxin-antitoxin system